MIRKQFVERQLYLKTNPLLIPLAFRLAVERFCLALLTFSALSILFDVQETSAQSGPKSSQITEENLKDIHVSVGFSVPLM
ncbi:MAG: hypothetical protein V7776_10895 [Halopseudomonas aestusnigri]